MSEARKRLLGPDDVAEAPDDERRAVDPKAALEDEVYGASLRPRSFDEYIGQANVVENLKIAIDAANKRGEVLDHVLLYGPPGLGKTTLAALIAQDLHRSLRPTSGRRSKNPRTSSAS